MSRSDAQGRIPKLAQAKTYRRARVISAEMTPKNHGRRARLLWRMKGCRGLPGACGPRDSRDPDHGRLAQADPEPAASARRRHEALRDVPFAARAMVAGAVLDVDVDAGRGQVRDESFQPVRGLPQRGSRRGTPLQREEDGRLVRLGSMSRVAGVAGLSAAAAFASVGSWLGGPAIVGLARWNAGGPGRLVAERQGGGRAHEVGQLRFEVPVFLLEFLDLFA